MGTGESPPTRKALVFAGLVSHPLHHR
jgi:hypothetical protein